MALEHRHRPAFVHPDFAEPVGAALKRDPLRIPCARAVAAGRESPCYTDFAAYTAGAAVAKLAYAAGLKSAGDFPVVGSTPTSRTILSGRCRKRPPSAPGSC